MADPLTIGLTVASTAFSAIQERNAGKVAQAQANQQAQIMQAQAAQQQQIALDQQRMLNYQATQMETIAGQERASAQRAALMERRKQRLAQSRATALAAAGTGDTLDPSVINILGDLEAEGSLAARTALWTGEERARDYESTAAMRRAEGEMTASAGIYQAGITRAGAEMTRDAGKIERQAANSRAIGTLIKGGSSLYDKYGEGGAVEDMSINKSAGYYYNPATTPPPRKPVRY